MPKPKAKKPEPQRIEGVSANTPPPSFPIKGIIIPNKQLLKPKDVLKLQSQLIKGFIKGTVFGYEAKTLSYLCSNYLNNVKEVDHESRIKSLEDKLQ